MGSPCATSWTSRTGSDVPHSVPGHSHSGIVRARVARQVFITAPNRYFPVEHHTAIPVMHYWRPTFALACKTLGKGEWLAPENLILTGIDDLQRLNPAGRVGHTGLALGPFSSNIYIHAAD